MQEQQSLIQQHKMVEFLIARKRNSNLTFRILRRDKNDWGPEDFGSSGKALDFEAVIRNRDPNLIAYLLADLKNQGYPIDKAIAKYREASEKPGLFFLE